MAMDTKMTLDELRAQLESAKAENARLKAAADGKKAKAAAKKAKGASKPTAEKKPKKVTAPKEKGAAKPVRARTRKESEAAPKPEKKGRARKEVAQVEMIGPSEAELAEIRAKRKRKGGKPHHLVVVESPAKAKTIKKYLGSGYTVKASVGHLKDLPKSKMGVDIEHGFEPEYHVIKTKEKVLAELKRAAAGADSVFLATDPDREGEAIAFHISDEIRHPQTFRVLFNEITKKAIQESMSKPGQLNRDNYDSQQTRRILDRIVGYQISPLLWKKVRRGLSAGRVQSVAVRQIVEREEEIKKFIPVEYWSLDAELLGGKPPPFRAHISRVDGKKAELTNGEQTHALVESLRGATYTVAKLDKRERRRNAPAPFITSKLQQEAANRLGFTARKTMTLAQRLYEGVPLGEEGQTALITYMRTDSVRLSADAVTEVRTMIGGKYGAEYLPEDPVVYKTKKSAQDAHEAIRPTTLEWPPERVKPFLEDHDDKDMFRLYELIWNRFVACQMKPAVYDQASADIAAGRAIFRATGSMLKFPGYLAVYGASLTPEEEADKEKAQKEGAEDEDAPGELPELTEGQVLQLGKLIDEQHFTQPPPRFTEASLVKELEEKGIGRPSTYAAILSVIQDKKYVEKGEGGRFRPTILGNLTTEMLVKHFPTELDATFTAGMEEKLDLISEGGADWRKVLQDFYDPFKETLSKAEVEMRDLKAEEIKTDLLCEKCGSPMIIKWGKMGHFLACSGYPECKNTAEFKEEDGKIIIVREETTDEVCDKCGKPMVVKRGRFGRFLACSGYPDCKSSKPISIGINCPDCKVGYLTERRSRRGKIFFGCNRYPDCKFAAWDRPVAESCPSCASPYLLQKFSKREGPYISCPNKECDYKRPLETSLPGAVPGPTQPAADA